MARRRGFFAEIQHQAKVSQREAEVRQNKLARERQAAARRAEQAWKTEQRAFAAARNATAAQQKQLERAAKAARVAFMQLEVEQLNAELAGYYAEIDGLLEATLDVDDYVDLDQLRRTAEHPPFPRPDLQVAQARPARLQAPAEPTLSDLDPIKGIFGRKKKAEQAKARAESELEAALVRWRQEVDDLPRVQAGLDRAHADQEAARVSALERAQAIYREECMERQAEVDAHNADVDALVAGLGYGTPDAVREYIDIVLGNSVYPEHFEVKHVSEFTPESAELTLRVLVPPPSEVRTINSYRYVKASDEITSSTLSQKAIKDRYASAVHQVALRSLHEIFEADRRGLIRTISLEVGTETISPGTGQPIYVPFVAVGASRDGFLAIDLAAVVPAATLEHLGAAVSKNPVGLVPAAVSGVRRS